VKDIIPKHEYEIETFNGRMFRVYGINLTDVFTKFGNWEKEKNTGEKDGMRVMDIQLIE